jgi:phospholipase/carboxylesterase
MNALRCVALLFALALPACDRPSEPPPPPAAARPSPPPGPPEAAGVRYLERLTGGARKGERLPLVVAVHGFGDRPEAFVDLFADLGAKARLIVPFGLEPYGEGFSWFPIGALDDPPRLAEGTGRAADRLAAMIEAVVKARPTAGKPIVTGFSQGGMLSYTLAVRHPEVVGAAFPVGGLIALPLVPASWPTVAERPSILAFHGDADRRVPVARDRETVARLAAIGFDAKLREHPGVGHAIPPPMRAELLAALADAVVRASR